MEILILNKSKRVEMAGEKFHFLISMAGLPLEDGIISVGSGMK